MHLMVQDSTSSNAETFFCLKSKNSSKGELLPLRSADYDPNMVAARDLSNSQVLNDSGLRCGSIDSTKKSQKFDENSRRPIDRE